MPTLLFKEFGLVKGVRFSSDRRVGAVLQAIRVYNRRGVDELIFFDVAASLAGRPPDFARIDQFADECFMPLTVGGGVRSIDDFEQLLAVGADKVTVNSAAITNPDLIARASQRYGAQCVVVAIDVRRKTDGWSVWSHCGTRRTELDPVTWARDCQSLGAGEILLTSIDRDGTMEGYDVQLTRRVADAVSIPVVASGGAGTYAHMAEVLIEGKASAVAAASIYHYTECTPREAKAYIKSQGVATRL